MFNRNKKNQKMNGCCRITPEWSATLPLPDYGRVTRYSGINRQAFRVGSRIREKGRTLEMKINAIKRAGKIAIFLESINKSRLGCGLIDLHNPLIVGCNPEHISFCLTALCPAGFHCPDPFLQRWQRFLPPRPFFTLRRGCMLSDIRARGWSWVSTNYTTSSTTGERTRSKLGMWCKEALRNEPGWGPATVLSGSTGRCSVLTLPTMGLWARAAWRRCRPHYPTRRRRIASCAAWDLPCFSGGCSTRGNCQDFSPGSNAVIPRAVPNGRIGGSFSAAE
jgi:hypothetical protein